MSADKIDARTRTELEAAAFRTLVAHLRERTDVQNIDLMNLAGFCRNCLSKWYRAAAEERGVALTDPEAREIVYGMPYDEWRKNASEGGDAGTEGGVCGFAAEALTPETPLGALSHLLTRGRGNECRMSGGLPASSSSRSSNASSGSRRRSAR